MNKYVNLLGYAAAVFLVIGVAGRIATVSIGEPAGFGVPLVVGLALGVVWLVVKAVTRQGSHR